MIPLIFAVLLQIVATANSGYPFSYESAEPGVVSMHSADALQGWILMRAGDKAKIGYTSDGGKHWDLRPAPDDAARLWFETANTGWVVTIRNRRKRILNQIFITLDGGQTWRKGPVIANSAYVDQIFVTGMAFVDSRHGFVVVQHPDRDLVLQTTDGGESFSESKLAAAHIQEVVPTKRGSWFVTPNGVVFGGKLGSEKEVRIDGPINQQFQSGLADTALFLGGTSNSEAVIYKSTNGGLSWHKVFSTNDGFSFFSFSKLNENGVCAVGQTQNIWCSLDLGNTWEKFAPVPMDKGNNLSPRFSKLHLVNRSEALILRDGGYLYRTSDSGRSWIQVQPWERQSKPAP